MQTDAHIALCTFAACNNRSLINHAVVNDNENALKRANVSTCALKIYISQR